MDVLSVFVATWTIGIIATMFTFSATRHQSWWVRTALRTLALAATFTPGILAAGHGAAILPAIAVFLLGINNPNYSGGGPIELGLMPIAFVWGALILVAYVWTTAQRPD
jgi:hypothetical protein